MPKTFLNNCYVGKHEQYVLYTDIKVNIQMNTKNNTVSHEYND